MAGVAKEIGEGDYGHKWSEEDIKRNFRDEIDKVAQRERSLRARVR